MKVFLVDDHPELLSVLVEFLEGEDGVEVLGSARTAREAMHSPLLSQADVVVIDVSLPLVSGPELVRLLQQRWPHLRCLMLSGHDSPAFIHEALQSGARGYVLKEDPYELLEAIRRVHNGEVVLSRT